MDNGIINFLNNYKVIFSCKNHKKKVIGEILFKLLFLNFLRNKNEFNDSYFYLSMIKMISEYGKDFIFLKNKLLEEIKYLKQDEPLLNEFLEYFNWKLNGERINEI